MNPRRKKPAPAKATKPVDATVTPSPAKVELQVGLPKPTPKSRPRSGPLSRSDFGFMNEDGDKSASQHPCPNNPSFDWIVTDGEKVPNFRKDEVVIRDGGAEGLQYVLTNFGRKIWLCTYDEYTQKLGAPGGELAAHKAHFPQAFL